MLTDPFARRIDYLRLSVTDRCNLRCVYCLPEIYDRFTPHAELLTDAEIVSLVERFAELGVSKLRITGGEPLLRPGLDGLVHRLSRIPGIEDLSMSTNGVLLAKQAESLAAAGLGRVNISMDSLSEPRFAGITRAGRLGQVREALEAALAAGLSPVKINVVVARGMNEDELGDFARLTEARPLHVRFIELMPMGETGFFTTERWVPLEEMMERAGPLEPLDRGSWPAGSGPARYFRRPGALGTVGFISALSCGFCSSCNRVRLSARGQLIPCLDAAEGTDLRTPLRAGAGIVEIRGLILQTVERKPERHFMLERATRRTDSPSVRFMCQVGG